MARRPASVTEINRPLRGEAPKLGVSFNGAAIFEPLPPIPWVCEKLDLCPGAPALVAGYGYSGKTVALQALALSVAAGLPAWGRFTVRHGSVLHLDFEQGSYLTKLRYQRIARSMGIGPDDLAGTLLVGCHPPSYLDRDVEDSLVRAFDGNTLAIIDSLRAAAPSIDENSSEMRRPLDMLGRVSERTGCAILVILHARKPSRDSEEAAKTAIRGSSALFDAASSVLVVVGDKDCPTRTVSHLKARMSGTTAEDFALRIEDEEIDGDPRGGLLVKAESVDEKNSKAWGLNAKHDEALLEIIRSNPGATKRTIRASADGISNAAVDESVQRLIVSKKVVIREGKRGAHLHYLSEVEETLGDLFLSKGQNKRAACPTVPECASGTDE